MPSIDDLAAMATAVAVIFAVTVAVTLTVLATLAPQPDVRARAEHLLLLLFGRRTP